MAFDKLFEELVKITRDHVSRTGDRKEMVAYRFGEFQKLLAKATESDIFDPEANRKIDGLVTYCIKQNHPELAAEFCARFLALDTQAHILDTLADDGFKEESFDMLRNSTAFSQLVNGPELKNLLEALVAHASQDATEVLNNILDGLDAKNKAQPDNTTDIRTPALAVFKANVRNHKVLAGMSTPQILSMQLLSYEVKSEAMIASLYDQLLSHTTPGAEKTVEPKYAQNLFTIISDQLDQKQLAEGLKRHQKSTMRKVVEETIREVSRPTDRSGVLKAAMPKRRLRPKAGMITIENVIGAVRNGDVEDFKTYLIAMENRSQFELERIADATIQHDRGEMLRHLYETIGGMTLDAHLRKAGVVRDRTRPIPLKPNIANVLLATAEFHKRARDGEGIVSEALNSFAISVTPQSLALFNTTLAQLAPNSISGTFRDMVVDHTLGDHFLKGGNEKIFEIILSKLAPKDCETILKVLGGTLAINQQNEDAKKNMRVRIAKVAAKASQPCIDELHRQSLQNGNALMLDILAPLATPLAPQELLTQCCSMPLNANATGMAESLRQLEQVLSSETLSGDDLFGAMGLAIQSQKKGHLLALLDYAKDDGNIDMDELLNRHREKDHKSLLTLALGMKFGKDTVEMVDMLAAAGAKNVQDGNGKMPLSMMGASFDHSTAKLAFKRLLERHVDISTIGLEEEARLVGKLGAAKKILRALPGAHMSDDELLRRLIGGGVSEPQQPSSGVLGITHTQSQEKPKDTDSPER